MKSPLDAATEVTNPTEIRLSETVLVGFSIILDDMEYEVEIRKTKARYFSSIEWENPPDNELLIQLACTEDELLQALIERGNL